VKALPSETGNLNNLKQLILLSGGFKKHVGRPWAINI